MQCPGLHITKMADATTVNAGDAIGFTIGVSNSGPGTATGVTLTDPLPGGSGVSWSISPANAVVFDRRLGAEPDPELQLRRLGIGRFGFRARHECDRERELRRVPEHRHGTGDQHRRR